VEENQGRINLRKEQKTSPPPSPSQHGLPIRHATLAAARLGRDRRGVERRQPGSSRVALEGLWVYETIITKNAKVNIEDEERRCFGNEDEEPTEDVLNSKCCNIFLSFMISFRVESRGNNVFFHTCM
jgi:hypothetical protein